MKKTRMEHVARRVVKANKKITRRNSKRIMREAKSKGRTFI